MTSCLVIDQSSIVVKVATRILAGIDVDTAGAATLAEAERLLAKAGTMPAIIIVSASLADTPVDVAVRALRARSGGAAASILVSLVDTNLGLMTRAKRAGADGFIFRPFDRPSLLAWIDPYLKVAA